MVTEALRKKWRENWLFSIFALTCLNYQKRVWIEAAGKNIIDSFREAKCIYLEDLHIGEAYAEPLAEELISPEEYELLANWHKALTAYHSPVNTDSGDKAIVEDVRWRAVLDCGVIARRNLKIYLSKAERAYLEEIENSFTGR
jgi:hypothetical protein